MTDIVERLRQEIGGYTDVYLEKAEANMREAADEIERLREEVAQITKDRNRHSGMVIDLLDKYFDSATIRTTGGRG